MVVGIGYGGAGQALQVLATLGKEGVVRRQQLNEARKLYGDIDLITFRRGWAAAATDPFAIGVSTSMDPVFNAQMGKNLNNVAEKVRQYVVADNQQYFVEYEYGEMRYHALFQGEFAYLAVWKHVPDVAVNGTLIQRPLQITDMTASRGIPDLEADLLLTGKSVKDDVAAVRRNIIVADMLEKVRVRQSGMSVKAAVRNWRSQLYMPGYPDAGVAFMYKRGLKWVGVDSRAVYVPMGQALQIRLEYARRESKGSEMAIFEPYADRDDTATLLPEMIRIAGSAYDLSKKYDDWLAKNQRPGYDQDALAGGADALAGGADALAGGEGDDICYGVPSGGSCGGITAAVVGGISGFGDILGMMLAAHIRRVEAAIAAYQEISGLTADQKQEIRKLHGELSGILRTLRSHVDGKLQLIRAEKMLGYQAVWPEVMEESNIRLSGWGSDLAVMVGQLDALNPEDEHIAARKIKYSFIHKAYDGGPITMLRVKENKKPSFYVAWMYDDVRRSVRDMKNEIKSW